MFSIYSPLNIDCSELSFLFLKIANPFISEFINFVINLLPSSHFIIPKSFFVPSNSFFPLNL